MFRWLGVVLVATTTLAAVPVQAGTVKVKLETTMGSIVLELDEAKAPKTVANFLEYVRTGFYDMTIFHRVIPGFVVQGGGFTIEGPSSEAEMVQKPTRSPIPNEAGNGLKNLRGTICMARTAVVDSATSQFFINLADNVPLDHRDNTQAKFGYCVFGKVVEGMQVVDAIAGVPTGNLGVYQNVPTKPVYIKKATLMPAAATAAKPPAATAPDQPKTK